MGDVNHAFATWIVALTTLESASPVIPTDLTLGWQPTNKTRSLQTASDVAKRSVLSLILMALDDFFETLRVEPRFISDQLATVLQEDARVVERIQAVADHCKIDDETVHLLTVLRVWRNKLIHPTKARLDGATVGKLRRHASRIAEDYASCDVEKLIEHTNMRGVPSRVETLALILAAQRFVLRADRFLIQAASPDDYLRQLIKSVPTTVVRDTWALEPHRRRQWLARLCASNGASILAATPNAVHCSLDEAIERFSDLEVREI